MQNNHDIFTIQDTSTQAMTEVALGLSMAFFALLIIALMSVALPSQTPKGVHTRASALSAGVEVDNTIEFSMQSDAATPGVSEEGQNDVSSESSSAKGDKPAMILLFWDGKFFDTQQQLVNVNEANTSNNIIVAVSPQLPFAQLMKIQSKFNDDKMQLTTLTPQWQKALSETTLGVQQYE